MSKYRLPFAGWQIGAAELVRCDRENRRNAVIGIAVGGSWYFGMNLGWLAVGVYAGMALDKCIRALFMFLHWHKGIRMNKSLVSES